MLGRLGAEAAVAAQQTAASGTSAWDTAARFTDQMIKNAAQGYGLYQQIRTGVNPTPPPAPTLAQSQTNTSKLLLYGGLAVAAIAVVMYMRKK